MLEQVLLLPHAQYFMSAAEVAVISELQIPLAARVQVVSVALQQYPAPLKAEYGQKTFPTPMHWVVHLSCVLIVVWTSSLCSSWFRRETGRARVVARVRAKRSSRWQGAIILFLSVFMKSDRASVLQHARTYLPKNRG